MAEGSLEIKLPTIWIDESRDGKSQPRKSEEKVREEKRRKKKIKEENVRRKQIKEEKVRRKKMHAREKVGKSRNTIFFQCSVAPEGRKAGSLKRRVQSHLAR